jgi:hypothetical protein
MLRFLLERGRHATSVGLAVTALGVAASPAWAIWPKKHQQVQLVPVVPVATAAAPVAAAPVMTYAAAPAGHHCFGSAPVATYAAAPTAYAPVATAYAAAPAMTYANAPTVAYANAPTVTYANAPTAYAPAATTANAPVANAPVVAGAPGVAMAPSSTGVRMNPDIRAAVFEELRKQWAEGAGSGTSRLDRLKEFRDRARETYSENISEQGEALNDLEEQDLESMISAIVNSGNGTRSYYYAPYAPTSYGGYGYTYAQPPAMVQPLVPVVYAPYGKHGHKR